MQVSSPQWVQALKLDPEIRQIIVAAGVGQTTCTLSMHQREGGGPWQQLLATPGFIGKNGLGKAVEGDNRTPVGIFTIDRAFGILPDPGCALPYTQVNKTHFWSGDPRPGMGYNQFVTLPDLPDLDQASSEQILSYGPPYHYCLNMGYNPECTPDLGSALFLHCLSVMRPYTAGCVAVPEDKMRQIMTLVQPGCRMVIDSMEHLGIIL